MPRYHPQDYSPSDAGGASRAAGLCDGFRLSSFSSLQRADVRHPNVDPGQLWVRLFGFQSQPDHSLLFFVCLIGISVFRFDPHNAFVQSSFSRIV